MKLNEPLVNTFDFGNKVYNLDCSFDVVLDVFEMFEDDVMNDLEKMQTAIEIMTGEIETNPDVIAEIWFYIDENFITFKKEKIVYDRNGNPMPSAKSEEDNIRLIDFEIDAQDIYASFRQAYSINLFEEQGRLSWQEFAALLNGLPEDTSMMKIIQIRNWKPSGSETSGYKSKMRKLQRKYRLDREEEE